MAQKVRNEIEEQFKWNIADIFGSIEEWRQTKENLSSQLHKFADFKGSIGQSAKQMLDFLTFDGQFDLTLRKVSLYASLLYDEDLANADNAALCKEVEQLEIDYRQVSFFATPEMAAIDRVVYDKFMAEEPALADYSMIIDRILNAKEHTLSDAEEALMAKTSMLGNASESAYSVFSDAEMPSPKVVLSNGQELELDSAAFVLNRCSAVRADRQLVTQAFWDNYQKFEGTFGEMMNGNVRQSLFYAMARKYPSCLSNALSYNKIPEDVYSSLIDNVNKNLPTFHRYLKLKKRLLGVDQLEYSDLYATMETQNELTYSYAEAQKLVLNALKPLGDEYCGVVKRAFDERWIDVFPNKGKASGAYSNGAAYDVHPYILMNFDGRYDSVSTLIHELGHTMQSYFSNKFQPFAKSDYSIFVAEVASTFNEALLDDYMLSQLKAKDERLFLLMSMLDGFKGTLFRQTQFAEFQWKMVQKAEKGEPITGKVLSELYLDITRRYYGHDAGVCTVDDRLAIEWAYIHHFYMGFYVYQYSTSFVASQALTEMVLKDQSGALSRYMDFLKAGDSKYPIDELTDAGVNMLTSEPFDLVIVKMNKLMNEVEKLL